MDPRRTYQQNHIERGLCIYCPRIPLKGKICRKCRVTRCKIYSRYRERNKAKGKCTRCPRILKNTKFKTCIKCRLERSKYMERKRNGRKTERESRQPNILQLTSANGKDA